MRRLIFFNFLLTLYNSVILTSAVYAFSQSPAFFFEHFVDHNLFQPYSFAESLRFFLSIKVSIPLDFFVTSHPYMIIIYLIISLIICFFLIRKTKNESFCHVYWINFQIIENKIYRFIIKFVFFTALFCIACSIFLNFISFCNDGFFNITTGSCLIQDELPILGFFFCYISSYADVIFISFSWNFIFFWLSELILIVAYLRIMTSRNETTLRKNKKKKC